MGFSGYRRKFNGDTALDFERPRRLAVTADPTTARRRGFRLKLARVEALFAPTPPSVRARRGAGSMLRNVDWREGKRASDPMPAWRLRRRSAPRSDWRRRDQPRTSRR